MELKLTNSRGYELASFLTVAPKQIGNLKNFSKIQRFRLAVEKSLGDYKKTLDEFQVWRANELKPYQEALAEFKQSVDGKKGSDEKVKAKQIEIDKAASEALKERSEEALKYETENAPLEVTVTVNEEDLSQVKTYFEDHGHDFPYWANYPDSYMQVAKFLGFEV